jgi:hypothetical protein
MATSQELPEWMTEEQMDELAGIIDNIIGKGIGLTTLAVWDD